MDTYWWSIQKRHIDKNEMSFVVLHIYIVPAIWSLHSCHLVFYFDGFQCSCLLSSCYKHPSVCLFVCLMLAPWWILAEQWRKIKRINLTGSFLFSVFSYFLSMLVSMMIFRFFCLPMHVASKNPFNISTTNEIKFNEKKLIFSSRDSRINCWSMRFFVVSPLQGTRTSEEWRENNNADRDKINIQNENELY